MLNVGRKNHLNWPLLYWTVCSWYVKHHSELSNKAFIKIPPFFCVDIPGLKVVNYVKIFLHGIRFKTGAEKNTMRCPTFLWYSFVCFVIILEEKTKQKQKETPTMKPCVIIGCQGIDWIANGLSAHPFKLRPAASPSWCEFLARSFLHTGVLCILSYWMHLFLPIPASAIVAQKEFLETEPITDEVRIYTDLYFLWFMVPSTVTNISVRIACDRDQKVLYVFNNIHFLLDSILVCFFSNMALHEYNASVPPQSCLAATSISCLKFILHLLRSLHIACIVFQPSARSRP